ncbi:MAG: hypothetical protein EBZ62_06255 [Sphingobacteriia bacterium]|nr:hypothetical protein [Sphingobacteriia bacterium]
MSDEARQRCAEWKDYGSDRWAGRCGVGIAINILTIEARLDALESSRAVQSTEETVAEGANDPGRYNTPSLTDEQREAICFCLSCAQDYRDGLESCDNPSREQCERATRMIAIAGRLAVDSKPQTLPPRETWPPHLRPRDEATADDDLRAAEGMAGGVKCQGISLGWEKVPVSVRMHIRDYSRRATPAEAVADDAGRRLVDGVPMTPAEMMHALTVAREEIARLTAERDAAKQRFREYEHMVMTGRSEQHDRLVAERDEAKAEVTRLKSCHADAILVGNRMVYAMHAQRDEALRDVEKHRMTADERKAFESASWPFGTFPRMNPLRSAYLDRTREEE